MPIQTNCAQAIYIIHVPLPCSTADAELLRCAFINERLVKGSLSFSCVKDSLVQGRFYAGERLVIQIGAPFPIEVISDKFWRLLGRVIAKTKEPWWDFCEVVEDFKPKKNRPDAHAMSAWRVTRKGEFRYLFIEDTATPF
jgi:hypothetical protein